MTDKNYAVGYGRPPKASQFKKGESGNPAGRPKRAPSLKEVMNKVAARPVTINTGQGPEAVPMLEAIVMAQANAALKGGVGAGKAFTGACNTLGIGVEAVDREPTEDDKQILEDFLRTWAVSPAQADQ